MDCLKELWGLLSPGFTSEWPLERYIPPELGTDAESSAVARAQAARTALAPGAAPLFSVELQGLDQGQAGDFGNYVVGALPPWTMYTPSPTLQEQANEGNKVFDWRVQHFLNIEQHIAKWTQTLAENQYVYTLSCHICFFFTYNFKILAASKFAHISKVSVLRLATPHHFTLVFTATAGEEQVLALVWGHCDRWCCWG